MIYTVYCSSASTIETGREWQSQLLGYSWARARQPGELVHLLAGPEGAGVACHPLARVLETQCWSPHPFTGDPYPPYQLAAGLLEWLFVERIEGTVLLVEPTSVFRAAVADQVSPGHAAATAWADLPRGEGPFGLARDLDFLADFCVDRTLELPAVKLPVLVHSTDLRKIVVRWLELMAIIRAETAGTTQGPMPEADKIAYVIAAAEARIPHAIADLAVGTDSEEPDTARSGVALLDYRRPIPSLDGMAPWDPGKYQSWEPVAPEAVRPGFGREFLTLLAELLERRGQALDSTLLRPRRQEGVREGKILGSTFLEIPGREDTVSLNSSGAAIWEICDGTRNLAQINQELETRFEMPAGSLRPDVEVVIKRLEGIGALRLESA